MYVYSKEYTREKEIVAGRWKEEVPVYCLVGPESLQQGMSHPCPQLCFV